jgi:enoyl-[acyl-carrier-protein] reductase (NADH)
MCCGPSGRHASHLVDRRRLTCYWRTKKAEITANIEQGTLLGRAATLADVGNVSAFVASDQARTLTATEVNISCGALVY